MIWSQIIYFFGNEKLELKLIDFGLCSNYLDENGNHIEENLIGFKGNMAFSGPNVILGYTPSRRDDMVSLAYLMLYLHQDTLRFLGITPSESTGYQEILDAKLSCTTMQMCGEKSLGLFDFINEVYSLSFQDTPNYKKLLRMLENCMENYMSDCHINWVLSLHCRNSRIN